MCRNVALIEIINVSYIMKIIGQKCITSNTCNYSRITRCTVQKFKSVIETNEIIIIIIRI